MIRKNQASKGFTLIELMIVVAIIGVLSAIAIPKFADLVNRSREASIKSKLGALRSALTIYYSDNQGFPDDLTTSLTTGARYLQALPTIRIPVATSYANPGHDETTGEVTSLDDMTTGAWFYAPGGDVSSVTINCTHTDSKGASWTSF